MPQGKMSILITLAFGGSVIWAGTKLESECRHADRDWAINFLRIIVHFVSLRISCNLFMMQMQRCAFKQLICLDGLAQCWTVTHFPSRLYARDHESYTASGSQPG